MPSLFRKLIDLITPAPEAPREVIYLAAFGKHPAWDDHIDDIGVVTEHLAETKRSIYIDGIGGNIDSGAWDQLESIGQAIAFNHVFLWRRSSGELLIGRMWASKDGKGRSRFPMVLCAECHGLPMQTVLDHILPALDKLKADCSIAADADAVRGFVEAAQQAMRQNIAELNHSASEETTPGKPTTSTSTTVTIDPFQPSPNANRLANCASMGKHGRGLLSVLYQIDREVIGLCRPTAFCAAPQEATVFLNSGITNGPQPLRVPQCEPKMTAAVALWFNFAMDLLDHDASLLMIWPVAGTGNRWIDLIIGVGDPSKVQLRCIRAALASIPLTTEIPYTLDPAFIDRAGKFIGVDYLAKAVASSGSASVGVSKN